MEEQPAVALLGDQEAQQLKRWYLDDMRGALRGRLRPAVTAGERNLLRLHFIDGLNIERIGVIYGVHRATVARWLVAIRRRLFEDTKAVLASKHGLDTADIKSLYRLMEADVHIRCPASWPADVSPARRSGPRRRWRCPGCTA